MSYRQVAAVMALTVTLGACGRGATTGSPAPPAASAASAAAASPTTASPTAATSASRGGDSTGMTEAEAATIERELDDIEKVLDETDAQLRSD